MGGSSIVANVLQSVMAVYRRVVCNAHPSSQDDIVILI